MDIEEIDFTDAKMLRKKAEEQLNSKLQKEILSKEDFDTKKLLHELQVHQIELEMQNTELRQTNEWAEAALKKFTMLFDLSPVGYFTLKPDGSICELNFTGAEILGEKRYNLINSNFKLFVSEDSKPVFNDFFRKVYTDNGNESCEVLLGKNKKSFYSVYIEGVVTEDDETCLLSVIDISKFRLDKNL